MSKVQDNATINFEIRTMLHYYVAFCFSFAAQIV